MDTSTSLSGESLPKNVNSHELSEIIEGAENLELSCNNQYQKHIEESVANGTANAELRLPPEMWIKIFRYLPQYLLFKTLRLVCTEWRDIVDCPDFWRIIDFQMTDIKHPFLSYVSERSDNIQSLTLSGSSVSDGALACALEQMPFLKRLFLDFCNCLNLWENKNRLSSTTTQYVGRTECVREGQTMSFAVIPNSGIDSCTLAAIGQHCPQLTSLHLTGQPKLTDDALEAIAIGCKNLRYLSLVYCRPFTSSGIDAIAKNCTFLHVLRLCSLRSSTFYSLDLDRLAEGCPNLTSLSLSGIKGKGQTQVDHLLKLGNFKNLIFLDVSVVEAINDDVIINLVKNLKRLRKINLSFTSIHDIAVKGLVLNGAYLEEVNLVGCKITEEALYYICHMSKRISTIKVGHCKGIKRPGIYKVHRKDRCEFLRPYGLQNRPLGTHVNE